jgi:hypothetical protein
MGHRLKLKNYLNKKRVLTNIIDTFIFFPLFFPLLPLLINRIIGIDIFNSFLFLPLFFIGYFGLITKMTNGYTIGGLITKTQIINLNQKKMSVIQYSKRTLLGLVSFLKCFVSGVRIMNGIGQYNYDKKYNTTVLPNDISIQSLDKSTIYTYHFYLDIFWIYIKYSFGLMFIVGTIISIL